jgi:hypothetical protein
MNPAKPKPPGVNSDQPNANARIVSQQTFGAADKVSAIWCLESADGISQWFLGEVDGRWGVGRLDPAGSLAWHSSLDYGATDLAALSSSSPMPGGAIVVGIVDSDGNGWTDAGSVTLITPTGGIASRQLYASDTSTVALQAIAPLSDTLFVVVGREHRPSGTYPLVALLALTDADTLAKRQQEVIASLSGQGGLDVATDPGDALAPIRRIYLSTGIVTGYSTITLRGMDISASTMAPWSLAWSRTVPGKGSIAIARDLRVLDGALYIAGWTNDPDKGVPSGGGFWSSGLVARLSLAGDIVWSKVLGVTGHSEEFRAIEPTAAAVVAIGQAACYQNTPSTELFGYGWVARLGPADGGTLSSFTFGDSGHDSELYGGYFAGSALRVGGSTQKEVSGGPSRAWWCALNVNSAAAMATVPQAARARAGERPVPDKRWRGRVE